MYFPSFSFSLGYSNDPVRTAHDMYLQVAGTEPKKNTEIFMCKVMVLEEKWLRKESLLVD